MSSTNWKNLGRKQGGNMKHNRNVKVDKAFYINGKWDTIYTPDNIKRLAYYNIDLPDIVGIGTNKPFSKLSFGDSSASGLHVSGIITPGKVTAIAMHEKSINKSINGQEKEYEGQDFTGFSYVTNLRSVRKVINNTEAKGIGIFANKDIVDEDTGLKTDKAAIYITDDNFVHIGGKPTQLNVIDGGVQKILPSATGNDASTAPVVTGPNIMLDVSGSIHVNGFINFLKNGADQANQSTDNPSGQLTYNSTTEQLQYASDPTGKNLRACPDGAIWVGWDKQDDTNTLSTLPRLYIQRRGVNTRILTEFDQDLIEGSSSSSGITWTGSEEQADTAFYVFRQPSSKPNNSIINTYIGRTGTSGSATNFDASSLPRIQNSNTTDPSPSSLSVVGNLSVFDFTTGGKNGDYLSGADTNLLSVYKSILPSDIYTKEDTITNGVDQKELGTIYMDRHLMIGGMKGIVTGTNTKPKFETFTSAIDISGGIVKKPIMRVLTGDEKGSLVTNSDCQDSIIIGNTEVGNITGSNKLSLIFGTQEEIENVNNTIVHGTNNSVNNLTNSLVVGNNLIAGNETTGAAVIDGLVALGVGDANLKVDGNDRIVLATKDGNNAVKALTVDKDGNVKIAKNLEVEGDHVHLEVTELKIQDPTLELNVDGNGTATNFTGLGDNGGLLLKENTGTVTDHKFLWYGNTGDAGEWRTYDAALSTGSGSAAGIFKSTGDNDVELKTGNSTTSSIKIENGANGDIDMLLDGTGKMKIGGTTPTITTAAAKDLKLDTNSGTNSGSITITDGVNGDITVAPNGDGKIKIGGTTPTITTDGTKNLKLDTNDGTSSGSITINQGQNGNIEIKPDGNGDVNLVTDMVKIGDTNEDVSIITNGEGVLKLETGGGSKDIEIKPNGSGKIIIYSDHVATTYDNNGDVDVPSSGARFKKNGSKVDLKISGKLTVDGLIDPTGLILDDGSGETLDATKCCITWDGNEGDSANLQVQFPDGSGGSTTKYIPFSGSANGGGSGGGGGGGGSVDKANTVKVEDIGTSTAELELVFCNSVGSGNNLYESLKSDRDALIYTPDSGTLKSTIFQGKATALNLSNNGFVKVDTNGDISVDSSSYALLSAIPTDNSTLNNGAGYITNVGNTTVTNVTKSGDDLTFTLGAGSTTVTFGRENIEDVLASMLTRTDNDNNQPHKNVTVTYDDTGGDNAQGILALEANGDLFLKSDGPRVIKVDEGNETNNGAGNNLTLEAGSAKGNNGSNGYNGGNIELVPGTATSGTSGGTNGTAGNVVIKGSGTIATDGDLTIAPSSSVVTLQGNNTVTPTITTGSNTQDLKIQPKSGITEFSALSGDAAVITSVAGKDLKIQPAVNSNVSNLKVESTTHNCRLSLEASASTTSTSGDYWTEIEMIAKNNQNNFITSNKTLKFIDEPSSGYNSYMDIEMNSTDHQNSKIKAYVPLQFSETKNGTITAEKRAVTDGSERGNPIIIRQGGVETSNIVGSPDLAGGNVIVYSGRTESKSTGAYQTQNDITSDCKFVIGSVDGLINNKTVEILDASKNTLTIKKAGNGFTAEAVYKLSIGEDVNGDEITEVDTLKGDYVEISVTIDGEGTNTGFSDENTWQVAKKLVDAVNNNRYLQSIGFEAGFKRDGTNDTEVYFYSRRDGLTLKYKNGSGSNTNAWPVNNNSNATDAGWMEWTDSGVTATLKPTKHLKITPSDIDFEAQSNGNGNNFTIKTQSGVGNDGGTGNNDGYDGGDLILEPGTGSAASGGGTNGTNGSVVIKNGFKVEQSIGGSLPSSNNSNVLVVDSNGNVTVNSISSASGNYDDDDVENALTTLGPGTGNDDSIIKMTDRGNNSDANKLIIKAQGFNGSANHVGNGGDLELSGGLGNGTGKTNGVVNITSGFKLGNSIFTTSDGPLEVTSGVVGVGSYSTYGDSDLTHIGEGDSAFTMQMVTSTDGGGNNFTIKGQNAKTVSNNESGGNLILSGGDRTTDTGGNTTSTNGKVIINTALKLANYTGSSVPLEVDSNGDVSVGSYPVPDPYLANLGEANQSSEFSIAMEDQTDGTGQNLTITAQNAGGTNNADGGNLVLSGGAKAANGSDGVVDITSGLTISSLSSSGGGPLEVDTNGVVSVGSNLSTLHDADANDGFTIGMIDHNSVGQDLTIKAQNAGGTDKAGGNLVLSGGDGTGTGSNGQVQVNSNLTMAGVNPTIASTTPSGGSAQPLRFKAADSKYTFMNETGTNPIINTEASKDLSIQPGSSNIRLGPANTTTDFTIKMPDHSTGEGKNLTIAAQTAGGTSDANGGNLILSGGAKAVNGSDGIVQVNSNLTLGTSTISNAFTIKMTDSTNSGSAQKLKIEGQKATQTISGNDNSGSGGDIEITGGEAYTASGGTAYGGNITLSAGGHGGNGTGYRGMIHMKNYPIIQDFTMWNGVFGSLPTTNSGKSYITREALLGGIVRIDPNGSNRDVYFPTNTEFNGIFPNATITTSGSSSTGTGFRCTLVVIGSPTHDTDGDGSPGPPYIITFKQQSTEDPTLYDNSTTSQNTTGFPITEGNSIDIIVMKQSQGQSGQWSVTRLN